MRAAYVRNDCRALGAQVTAAVQQVLERRARVRVRMSSLRGVARARLVPWLVLSGVGLGFITGELTKRRASVRRPGRGAAPAGGKLMSTFGTLAAAVRIGFSLLSLVTAPRSPAERCP